MLVGRHHLTIFSNTTGKLKTILFIPIQFFRIYFYFPANLKTPANKNWVFISKTDHRDLVFPIFSEGDRFWEFRERVASYVEGRTDGDYSIVSYEGQENDT